jgi:hypothetical protein
VRRGERIQSAVVDQIDHKPEEALEQFADHYNDVALRLEVGLPRGHKGVAGS